MSGFIPEEQKQQQEKRKRRSKFACNTKEHIQARSQRLYSRQLEGKTTRQLVLEHAKIEGIAETSAWSDWSRVSKGIMKIGRKIEKICFQDFKQ